MNTYPNAIRVLCYGDSNLTPCLDTHSPIDIVVLGLGTNDLKERFNLSPQDVGNNDESVPGVQDNYKGAEEKSKQLGAVYQKIAEKYNLEFIDLSKITTPGKVDGYHLEPESHRNIGEAVFEKINSIS